MGWIEEATSKTYTVDAENKVVFVYYPHDKAEYYFEEMVKKGNPWPMWNHIRETLPPEVINLFNSTDMIVNRWLLDRVEIRYT